MASTALNNIPEGNSYPTQDETMQDKKATEENDPSLSDNSISTARPTVSGSISTEPLPELIPIIEPSNSKENRKWQNSHKYETNNIQRTLSTPSITITTSVKGTKPTLKRPCGVNDSFQGGKTRFTMKEKSTILSATFLESVKRNQTYSSPPPQNPLSISDILASSPAPNPKISKEMSSAASHFLKTFILPQEKSSDDVGTTRSSQENLENGMTWSKENHASEHISSGSNGNDSTRLSTNNLSKSIPDKSLDNLEDIATSEKEINSKVSDSPIKAKEEKIHEGGSKPIVKSSNIKLSIEKEISEKKFSTLVKDTKHHPSSYSSNFLSFHDVTSSPSYTNLQDQHVSRKDCEPVCSSMPLKRNNNSITNINCYAREMTNIPTTSTTAIKSDKKLSESRNISNIFGFKIRSGGSYQGFAGLVDEIEIQQLSASTTFDSNKISDSKTSPVLDHENSEAVTLDALYELLLVTSQEMVNLRKVQEQILNREYTDKCLNSSENDLEHADERSSSDLKSIMIDLTEVYNCSEDNDKVPTNVSQLIDDKSKMKLAEPLLKPTEGKHSFDLLASEICVDSYENCWPHNLDEIKSPAKKMKTNIVGQKCLESFTSENDFRNSEGKRLNSNTGKSQLLNGRGISNSEVDINVKEISKCVLNNKEPSFKSFSQGKYVNTSTKNSKNAGCQGEMNDKGNYENQNTLSSNTKVNNSSKKLRGEIPSQILKNQSQNKRPSKYIRYQKLLIKMARTLPYSSLKRIVEGKPSLSTDTIQQWVHYPPTEHQISKVMTATEPKTLMSHHQIPIVPKLRSEFCDDRRALLLKTLEKQIIRYFQEKERKENLKKHKKSLKDLNDSSSSNMKKQQTVQNFQPKITVPLEAKESHSTIRFQNQQDALKESGLYSFSRYQQSVPYLHSVTHALPNTATKPATFSTDQYYSYWPSKNKARTTDMVPPRRQVTFRTPIYSPPTNSFSHALDQRIPYQPMLLQKKNFQPNDMTALQHSQIPGTSTINQNQYNSSHPYVYQNEMRHCPLAYSVSPQNYFPSRHPIHPSYVSRQYHVTNQN